MASTAPPPPPPPPPVFSAPKALASSQRPSTNSHNVGSVRPTQNTQPRAPFAGIHPETLQHAAAGLRKTQYREPLLAPEQEPSMGRQTELPAGGHRPSDAQHARFQWPAAGAPLHGSYAGPNPSAPLGQHNGAGVALNGRPGYTVQSYTTSYNSVPAYNNISTSPPPLPNSQPPPLSPTNFNNNNQVSVQPIKKDYSYSSGPGHQVQVHEESYQSPPNPNSSSSYSSYSKTETYNYNTPQQQQPRVQTQIYTYNPPPAPALSPHVYAQPFANGNGTVQPSQPSNVYSSSYQSSNSSTTTTNNYIKPANNNDFIANPKQYIYDFATRTPIKSPGPQQQAQSSPQPGSDYQQRFSSSSSTTTTRTTEQTSPRRPYDFATELRDNGLTSSQKYFNQFQKSSQQSNPPPSSYSSRYEIMA
ncbi:unnamed protein product [Bursaphelenchus okinawaensis]|uniref:Uncharacterized protein n=1 Tax=Bursaphelenchus okinawaensis TaxID=465554 RepID=A0A811KBT4_9BILA|nr:unnamed protein product [Bursaphelenchus okinawaensis]CAG9097308.1 unnamed protein product [Bursaphelenchus okinawaensis]